jgi:integrase
LSDHLLKVRAAHGMDLAEGFGSVYLPHALARKYPHADRDWKWQYIFPAGSRGTDPRTGTVRRHHLHESVIRKAIYAATRSAGLAKKVSCHTFRHNADFRIMPTRNRLHRPALDVPQFNTA